MSIYDLIGLTVVEIEGGDIGDDKIIFTTSDGRHFCMTHDYDCCEVVEVEDVCGDWDDILGNPIILAYESTSEDFSDYDEVVNKHPIVKKDHEYYDWTFYNIATIKGSVTIRWFGCHNGCYSTTVDLEEISDADFEEITNGNNY